jgi:phage-related holin
MALSNTPNESFENTHDTQQKITRRQVLLGLLTSVGAVGVSGKTLALDTLLSTATNTTSTTTSFYTAKEFELISRVADLIIPATETKGALGVGVPSLMDRLYSEWANANSQQTHRNHVEVLSKALDKLAKGDFLSLKEKQQTLALQNLDSIAFSDNAGELWAYREIKNTVARFYYLSEEGATKELRYEPVPGRWDGCIDMADVGKTWAV